jgi:hypothetical protein
MAGKRPEVSPEIRAEVIEATGLCLNLKCTGHDSVIARIWEFKHGADRVRRLKFHRYYPINKA